MPRTLSPLRYPGGKTQLYNFVKHTIELNTLTRVIYCEPFSGGAGVAISLLLSNDVDSIILNDFDIAIYSIWYAILNDTDEFIENIDTIPITIEEWNNQRNIYNRIVSQNNQEYNFDLALAAFFLNRTNRAGIITGGPIGGHKQNSKYDLDCRFNKSNLINKIKNISEQRHRIALYNLDATDLVTEILLNQNSQNLFTYFDPPYYKQGQKLYKNSFDDEKHLQLANAIRQMDNFKWIATYDNEDRIRNIYNDRKIHEYILQYSANKTRKETELLFHSTTTIIEPYQNVQFEIK